jgi:alkylation response protein AidB-like acyl-CoA dehydrogenase
MGSLAQQRAADDAGFAPEPSVAEEVRAIARKDLAPLAAAIDAGEIYPADLLRRLGAVGAWSSHVPENGAADLTCAIESIAALGEVCGATAFMAWCQNTLVRLSWTVCSPMLQRDACSAAPGCPTR